MLINCAEVDCGIKLNILYSDKNTQVCCCGAMAIFPAYFESGLMLDVLILHSIVDLLGTHWRGHPMLIQIDLQFESTDKSEAIDFESYIPPPLIFNPSQ